MQLLSNGKYHVMVTNAGGGYSRWKDIAVTRWREDGTCDNWGTFCYIRDLDNEYLSGHYLSSRHLKREKIMKLYFRRDRAEFHTKQIHAMETHTEIVVSPEDDIEIRRVHITNRSRKRRSY